MRVLLPKRVAMRILALLVLLTAGSEAWLQPPHLSRCLLSRLHPPEPTDLLWAQRRLTSACTAALLCLSLPGLGPLPSHASMLTFPLPAPLRNSVVFMRAGESYADEKGVVETAPVKKLSTANALTPRGREQAVAAARRLEDLGLTPTYIFTSNTERAYETATVVARELRMGQNRIVPEFSFLDGACCLCVCACVCLSLYSCFMPQQHI